MIRKRVLGIAALSVLAAGIGVAVRSLVPTAKAKAVAQSDSKLELRYTPGTRIEAPNTLLPRALEPPKAWHDGIYQPLAFDAYEVNDSIWVEARFRIYSKSPQPFVWSLWVFDLDSEGRDLVFHRRYDEQLAIVPAGSDSQQTFAEVIDVKPGRYFVRVAPLMVPPRGGLDRLALDYDNDRTMEDVDESSAWTLACNGGRVTIP